MNKETFLNEHKAIYAKVLDWACEKSLKATKEWHDFSGRFLDFTVLNQEKPTDKDWEKMERLRGQREAWEGAYWYIFRKWESFRVRSERA